MKLYFTSTLPPHQKAPSVRTGMNGKKARSVNQKATGVSLWCGGLLLISFVAIAVFGFAMMGPDDGHMGCIAAMAQGTAGCPTAFDMVALHLNAFNMFSSAVFGQNVLSLVLALNIFLLLLLSALFGSRFIPLPLGGNFRTGYYFEPPRTTFSIRLNHWFSLHENSPSLA